MADRKAIAPYVSIAQRAAWDALADRLNKKPFVLAEEVLLDFLACYLAEEEKLRLGLVGKGGHLLRVALEKAEEVREHGRRRKSSC